MHHIHIPPPQKPAGWYRMVTPRTISAEETPILVKTEDAIYQVQQVSPTELTFWSNRFQEGDWCCVDIILLSRKQTVTALIEITRIDESSTCTCRFKTLDALGKAIIEEYVTGGSEAQLWGQGTDD